MIDSMRLHGTWDVGPYLCKRHTTHMSNEYNAAYFALWVLLGRWVLSLEPKALLLSFPWFSSKWHAKMYKTQKGMLPTRNNMFDIQHADVSFFLNSPNPNMKPPFIADECMIRCPEKSVVIYADFPKLLVNTSTCYACCKGRFYLGLLQSMSKHVQEILEGRIHKSIGPKSNMYGCFQK